MTGSYHDEQVDFIRYFGDDPKYAVDVKKAMIFLIKEWIFHVDWLAGGEYWPEDEITLMLQTEQSQKVLLLALGDTVEQSPPDEIAVFIGVLMLMLGNRTEAHIIWESNDEDYHQTIH